MMCSGCGLQGRSGRKRVFELAPTYVPTLLHYGTGVLVNAGRVFDL